MGNGHLCALIIDIIGTAERKDIQNLTVKEIHIQFQLFINQISFINSESLSHIDLGMSIEIDHLLLVSKFSSSSGGIQ